MTKPTKKREEKMLTKIGDIVDWSRGVTVGNYTLRPMATVESVWIEQWDGEGGGFEVKELEKVIKKFYDKNF